MFKIITAFGEEYTPMGILSSRNKAGYAIKHGYSFINENLKNEGYPLNWQKLEVLISNMTGFGDWILWSDADSLIMNYNITLESLIDESNNMIFGFHMIDSIQNDYYPHSGNFLIKDTELAKEFLVKSLKRFKYENTFRMMEERAFRSVLSSDNKFNEKTKYIKIDNFCTIPFEVFKHKVVGLPLYNNGNFILHFMTPLTTNERLQMITKAINEVIV